MKGSKTESSHVGGKFKDIFENYAQCLQREASLLKVHPLYTC